MDLEKRRQEPTADTPPVELRASDADRDRIADILRDALGEGRITSDEHAERVEGVYRAKTVTELEPYVRDLPSPDGAGHPHVRPAHPAPNRPDSGAVPPAPDENLVAVFSSSVRRGRWRVSRRTHAYAVFGSVEIDLSEAVFEHRQVVVKAFCLFGNVEITVPENISLRGNGGGVLGNFEVDSLDSPDPDAPVVYVDGISALGNIEARARKGRRVANALANPATSDRMRKYLRF
ncbi:DUF1707 SHOCT-like domain-containing protein [Streptomyces uncialis]|uniref:DUF1707 domain-containing protein n=1 Tax=Streptomyces uncialis TaxID=1048205 RepID=A0A1Q4VEP0_9ACTN|nr:DUF1707 domain-containing protein [Streptomyces uncialis]OKH96287.1 hypothetical protein AB852_06640 [Streptomyces uncialis]WTE12984.1 DUF1707 domain-containing protein [Streptomyces uncialis]